VEASTQKYHIFAGKPSRMFYSPGWLQTEKEEELSGGGEGTDVQGNKFRLQQTSAWGSIAG